MNHIKLFCIPHAGGSAIGYYGLKKLLSPDITLHPLELSGRGNLFKKPLRENLMEMVDDLYHVIINEIDNCQYAILGHSLGGIIAYELTYKLKQNKYNPPCKLFVSGRKPPHLNQRKRYIDDLTDEELCKEILNSQGMSMEMYENKEMIEIFLPIIRSDIKAIETYQYQSRADKLDCDITVLCGTDDIESNDCLSEWANYTNGKCEIYEFEGNHFFLYKNKDVMEKINNILT